MRLTTKALLSGLLLICGACGRQQGRIVDSLVFEGNRTLSDTLLARMIPLKAGEPFDDVAFDRSEPMLRDSLVARGYLFAEVSSLLDFADGEVTVVFFVDEGPVVMAGDVEYLGLESVERRVIRRELRFTQGERITAEKIVRSVRRLYRTGLFDYVRIEPVDTVVLPGKRTVTVPVLVQVQEADMVALNIGGGYNFDEGWYLTGEVGYKNLWRLGHGIGVSGKVSGVLQGLRLEYDYPWIFRLPLYADFDAYLERLDEETFEGLFEGILAAVRGDLGAYNGYRIWTQFERVEYLDEPPPTEEYPTLPRDNTLLFGGGVNRDTRPSIFFPTRGMYTFLDAEIAGPFIGWSTKFYKLVGDFRFYRAFFDDRVLVASAAVAGYANGYGEEADYVPPQERFRAGDDAIRSIRGYPEQRVSPTDTTGRVRGGRVALVVTPADVSFQLYRFIWGAVFVDGGNVWRDFDAADLQDLRWSVGPGLRLVSPIGVARIGYGIRLDGDLDLDGTVQFGFGLPF